MRAFFLLTLFISFFSTIGSSWASDPDGIHQICEKKMNKYNSTVDCDCMVAKYYPKKAELSALYGVPMQSDAVLPHIQSACYITAEIEKAEYKVCMSSPTFKKSKQEFGAEKFCGCYSDEWSKQLDAYTAGGSVLDSKSRQHLKTMARAHCKRKFR